MASEDYNRWIEAIKGRYPGKFGREEHIFAQIHPGDRIFIGTGCGEPQHLVGSLIQYVKSHPKALL